jgi:tight adherence protein B
MFAVLVGVAASMFAVLAPSPAGAQTNAPANTAHQVQLTRVNSSDPSKVEVVFRYDGKPSDVAGLAVKENGKDVKATDARTLGNSGVQEGVVFVVDTSASTDGSATLAESKSAIKTLVDQLPGDTQVALVAAGSDALVSQRFTTDRAAFDKQLASLTPEGDGAMWEGVVRGASLVTDVPAMVGSMVVVTDGNTGTGTPFSDAQAAVISAGTTVDSFGVQGGKLGGEAHQLSQVTDGVYKETTKATDLTGLMASVAPQLSGLYHFTYPSATTQGVNDLTVTVGNATTHGSYVVGSDASGASALAYQAPPKSDGVSSWFQNNFGKSLAVVLGLIAAGLGAYAIISLLVKDDDGLESRLEPYSGNYVVHADEDADAPADRGMAQTAVMQRAVELTRQFAEQRGFLDRVESALERADLPLRAPEAMLFYGAGSLVVSVLSLLLTHNFFIFVVMLAIGALLPPAALNFLADKKRRQFEAMLPDTLQLLASTLRAGYSLMQGVEAISQEVDEPMGRELRRVVTEARLGRPLEDALEAVAGRMDSKDFAWAVMAIRIQREVGGNLSELLMTVAETMTQRERLRREVKTLTAEGRISSYVLGLLPLALGVVMYVLNHDYMTVMFNETIGRIMLAGGAVLMVGGFVWMQKIVKIDF